MLGAERSDVESNRFSEFGLEVRERSEGFESWWHAPVLLAGRSWLGLTKHWIPVALASPWLALLAFNTIPVLLVPLLVALTVLGITHWWNGVDDSRLLWEEAVVLVGDTVYVPEGFNRRRLNEHSLLRRAVAHARMREEHRIRYHLTYWLGPLPALWTKRAEWEYRAYGHQMVAWFEEEGRVPAWLVDRVVERMTGPEYGWMETPWSRDRVTRTVLEIRAAVVSGRIRGDNPTAVGDEWDRVLSGRPSPPAEPDRRKRPDPAQ